MSLNPVMLGVRFLLELTAIASFGILGWRAVDAPWRFLLVLILPIAVAALWGTFAVPNDPSRNGEATVAVAGAVRLLLEIGVLGGGVAALYFAGWHRAALISGIVLVVYQALAYDRIGWLLKR
ncbi:YrdB family protein [Nocardia sp. NPDC051030]|uniref:YrdB family protein n=1 Tax=Nocardia sp. NPDC051030 TaxID=3155162 RepID=UPI00341671DA